MTAVRTRGAKQIEAERGKECCDGLTAVVEDWHAKMCLLGVSLHLVPIPVQYLFMDLLMT